MKIYDWLAWVIQYCKQKTAHIWTNSSMGVQVHSGKCSSTKFGVNLPSACTCTCPCICISLVNRPSCVLCLFSKLNVNPERETLSWIVKRIVQTTVLIVSHYWASGFLIKVMKMKGRSTSGDYRVSVTILANVFTF